ncbi:MAG: glucoamylase family protein [Elusimicrobiota bacterium]
MFNRTIVILAAIMLFSASASASDDPLKTTLIDDFENKKLNSLGGVSGPWSIDPTTKKTNTIAEIVPVKGGPGDSTKSLKLSYIVDSKEEAITGYWTKLNGFDASDYDLLEFFVKGDKNDGFTTTLKIELKKPKPGSEKNEKLTGTKTIRNVNDKWQKISLPLYSFTGLFDKSDQSIWKDPSKALKNLDELVIVFNKRAVSSKKGTLYFDNIRFVKTGEEYPTVFDTPARTEKDKACIIFENPSFTRKFMLPVSGKKDEYEEFPAPLDSVSKAEQYLKAQPGSRLLLTDGETEYWMHLNDQGKLCFLDSENFMRFLLNRLGGFPSKTVVKKRFPGNDREFLKTIAKDTWAFFDNMIDKEYGIPIDTLILDKKDPLGPDTRIADYTNITNIGVYLCCVVSAYDLGFIDREGALERLQLTLNTIRKMKASPSGFLYNYYDTTWLEQTDYLVSFVDSGWLAAGIYVVKNAFPKETGTLCDELLSKWDFGYFYDNTEGHMYHGFIENINDYSDYHYGIFYTEPRLTSFIAIGRGDVEEEHWFRMTRTFPESYNWTTQKPKGRKEKKYKNIYYWGGWYEYNDSKFVPSWGGSMFEALMPYLLIDERKFAPKGLGLNDETHVRAAVEYTLKYLQYPVWGMSPSSNPDGGYGEFGVKPLGAKGYGSGIITPHATFLALEIAPKEAIENLRKMLGNWDIYGEYGFYDALDHKSDRVAYKYLALDQGMILMALDNYLNDGALRKYFQKDPVFKKAEHLLSAESFFEDK